MIAYRRCYKRLDLLSSAEAKE